MKKFLIGIILFSFTFNCFAGYSSGGRSGFSGGSRSFSSSRSYSTAGRSGYARSNNVSRSYTSPSTAFGGYRSSSNRTVVHHNHYSSGGSNSFFHGLLGGWIGGSMANSHNQVVVAGTPGMIGPQGMVVENVGYSAANSFLGVVIAIFFTAIFIGLFIWFVQWIIGKPNTRNRW